LSIAGGVALCNALSSAQLAAMYPASGGTYVYARERLGTFWGFLAGWMFVIGKLASCAAMALTFGAYVAPAYARPLAAAAVVALVAVNYAGVKKTVLVTKVILACVLAVLAFVVATATAPSGAVPASGVPASIRGLLQGAGFLFFAFAGYARVATLGEEVERPERTIPRAIPIALALAFVVYATMLVTLVHELDVPVLAASSRPLALIADPRVVAVGAAIAALGSLLSLIAGVSRTAFAMASNRDLPRALASVHPRFGVPHRAEVAVGVVVVTAVLLADLRDAIGFSSFAVLLYYALANASALTLSKAERRWTPAIAIAGVIGCLAISVSLPLRSTIAGAALAAIGALVYVVRTGTRPSASP
jgi:APA family basic amino acid/polyamine antiporter